MDLNFLSLLGRVLLFASRFKPPVPCREGEKAQASNDKRKGNFSENTKRNFGHLLDEHLQGIKPPGIKPPTAKRARFRQNTFRQKANVHLGEIKPPAELARNAKF